MIKNKQTHQGEVVCFLFLKVIDTFIIKGNNRHNDYNKSCS